jgi:hypothetical protein
MVTKLLSERPEDAGDARLSVKRHGAMLDHDDLFPRLAEMAGGLDR